MISTNGWYQKYQPEGNTSPYSETGMKAKFRLIIVKWAVTNVVASPPQWWCEPLNDEAKALGEHPHYIRFYTYFL
jgi:hypothetical protein